MWPFIKKINLPGFKKDFKGNLSFDLTDEEKSEVKKTFEQFKGSDGEQLAVHPDIADELTSALTAQGLSSYVQYNLMLALDLNEITREEFSNKAIASITKAYSIFPVPIFMYDLACLLEAAGRAEARNAFERFLELQQSFEPSMVQKTFFGSETRNIAEAISDAKQKADK